MRKNIRLGTTTARYPLRAMRGMRGAALLGQVLLVMGCAPQARDTGSVGRNPDVLTDQSVTDPSVVDTSAVNADRDLVTSVPNPSALLGINSLLVEEPMLAAGVTLEGVQSGELQAMIEEIAAQELSLKVYGAEWIRKNLTPARKQVAPSAGIDAILVTEVLQYRDREGSRIGGEPGAVAFRMTVVRLADKGEIWEATYSLKEESVTDNLFRIGERLGAGGPSLGWQSGREIFKRGVGSAFESFSSLREAQFLRR